ncbi:MAG: SCO family protein, partial [Candidatus Limnocylindrales bacterium]
MSDRHADRAGTADPEVALDAGFRLVVVMVGLAIVLGAVVLVRGGSGDAQGGAASGAAAASASGGSHSAAASIDPATFLYQEAREAPAISLEDQHSAPLTLASMRGGFVLVFFGYTHCPDVCPATIGTVGAAMRSYGSGVRAVFVTIDPERDTPAWLTEYDAYLPPGFTTLTGTADEIRATADAWGVRYARVDTGDPAAYSMSHTADVFIVDPAGTLRGHFPFGTSADAMTATLRAIATPPATAGSPTPATSTPAAAPSPSPSASPTVPATAALQVQVDSSAVWAGGPSPLILALSGPAGRLADTTIQPSVQLATTEGSAVGAPVAATAVRPPGVTDVSYVATVVIPTPGWWRIVVSATPGALPLTGSTDIAALDPGTSAPIGSPAPSIHSPTLGDVGGDVRRLSTDPIPDPRLYRTSTSDALAAHTPFVLVLDSTKFRVTSACGKALVLARYLEDRWPDVTFIHDEPFAYSVVTDTAVLDGSLSDPTLTDVAAAWGIGGPPWGALSMPWVFIVDGNGVVRAKYQGVMGSDDVDV